MEDDFRFKGKTIEELQKMQLNEFSNLVNSRARRTLGRDGNSQLYQRIERNLRASKKIRTHRRDIIVTPKMVGKMLYIYSGKEFTEVEIQPEMLGHYLGEFVFTRKRVRHGKAGIGATKSSNAISARK
jgi:small subunit ribosomal protein S19